VNILFLLSADFEKNKRIFGLDHMSAEHKKEKINVPELKKKID